MSLAPKSRGEVGFRFFWDRMLVESGASVGARVFAQAIRLDMGDCGERWIPQSTILARIPKSKRTVQRYRAELEAAGFVECSDAHRRRTSFKKGESVVGGCTTYTLTIPPQVMLAQTALWLANPSQASPAQPPIESEEVDAAQDEATASEWCNEDRAPHVSSNQGGRVTDVSPNPVERMTLLAPLTSPVSPVLVSPPVMATPLASPRTAGLKAKRPSLEEVATWLNDVLLQLHPEALEAFDHDWAIKLHDHPGKRDQVIKSVQAISDRPAALRRLRDVMLSDWDVRDWPEFAKRRRTEPVILTGPDGSEHVTVRCTWNNVAQLMLGRIYDELPRLRKYPTTDAGASGNASEARSTSLDIEALVVSMAVKSKVLRSAA